MIIVVYYINNFLISVLTQSQKRFVKTESIVAMFHIVLWQFGSIGKSIVWKFVWKRILGVHVYNWYLLQSVFCMLCVQCTHTGFWNGLCVDQFYGISAESSILTSDSVTCIVYEKMVRNYNVATYQQHAFSHLKLMTISIQAYISVEPNRPYMYMATTDPHTNLNKICVCVNRIF